MRTKQIAVTGFLIWLIATIVLRFAGQYVFRSTATEAALSLLLVSLPVMIWVTRRVLHRVSTQERAFAAIVLVSPGMLLDTFSTIWFSQIFPNIRADAAALFGGWLLFCNIVVLLTAILTWKSRGA
jgi:hypothetical protein